MSCTMLCSLPQQHGMQAREGEDGRLKSSSFFFFTSFFLLFRLVRERMAG